MVAAVSPPSIAGVSLQMISSDTASLRCAILAAGSVVLNLTLYGNGSSVIRPNWVVFSMVLWMMSVGCQRKNGHRELSYIALPCTMTLVTRTHARGWSSALPGPLRGGVHHHVPLQNHQIRS